MSGAIWSKAERRSAGWRRIWPKWRSRKLAVHARGVPAPEVRPLALIGSYDSAEAIDRAAMEFGAASFSVEDAILVRADRPSEKRVWRHLVLWTRRTILRQVPPHQPTSLMSLDPRAAGALLNAGGGFVLVRNAARFHRACEIIERTGGRIGCVSPAVFNDCIEPLAAPLLPLRDANAA